MVGPGICTQDLSDESLTPYRSELSWQPYYGHYNYKISNWPSYYEIKFVPKLKKKDIEMVYKSFHPLLSNLNSIKYGVLCSSADPLQTDQMSY